jgi:hypothetical protein
MEVRGCRSLGRHEVLCSVPKCGPLWPFA